MKAMKHNDIFNEDYKFFVRKQVKKNAQMLRKQARRNKMIFQTVPLIIREEPDDFPPEAA